MKQFQSLCGNTPLIKINEKVYAKLETYNPTGSVKDRMVSYVLNKAIQNGDVGPATVLCEATSGNTGIALSACAAALSLRCKIFMPSNMSEERREMMRAYGAEIVDAPKDDFETAIKMRDIFLMSQINAWTPNQFDNPDNIECHRTITAREISSGVESLGKKWAAFIHGSGTGGTIEGIRQYILNNPYGENIDDTRTIMVVPDESPHGIQGIGDGQDFLANPEDMHEVIRVKTDDAIARSAKFAKETGILVGISSGANILASERWASNNPHVDGVVVTMLCDRGERYMSIYKG